MQCHATARALAHRSGLQQGKWSVGFQSRLDSRWVKPFSDEIIKGMPAKGVKRMLVVSPAFVADCLETVIEIGEEYAELFQEHGGGRLDLVPSLNAQPSWVEWLSGWIKQRGGR
jgi:ferrochelatase